MSPQALGCWLSLQRIPGLGAGTLRLLLERFGAVEAVFAAPRAQLEPLLGRSPGAIEQILQGPRILDAERAWLEQPVHRLLTVLDEEYPPLLRELPQPPMVLFVAGAPECLARPQIAIVGSRNPTAGGVANAKAFAQALVQAGFAITSGLALGIDGAAHRGALAAKGHTVAVLGSGIDEIYPPRHEDLAREIVRQGAIVSEFPLGTPPKPENFPRRNRIISGLCQGTLVVEATLQSGSLITARLAVEQGREVFAVPGSIHSPLARGCHALIREGAKLVETTADILEELRGFRRLQSSVSAAPSSSALDSRMQQLLDLLGHDPVSIDDIVDRSGLTTHTVSSMLLEMELLGIVESRPGGHYVRR